MISNKLAIFSPSKLLRSFAGSSSDRLRLEFAGLNRLVGKITYHELRDAWQKQSQVTVVDFIADQELVYVHPDQSIRDVANTLVVQDKMRVPVVSQTPSALSGL